MGGNGGKRFVPFPISAREFDIKDVWRLRVLLYISHWNYTICNISMSANTGG